MELTLLNMIWNKTAMEKFVDGSKIDKLFETYKTPVMVHFGAWGGAAEEVFIYVTLDAAVYDERDLIEAARARALEVVSAIKMEAPHHPAAAS